MSTRVGWTVVAVLAVVIVVLAIALFVLPAPASAPTAFTSENVNVFSPLPGTAVARAFSVSGEARGIWYFEASFPIFVVNEKNEKVGQGIAMTSAEWMTENFVPFSAEVIVENYSGPASLVLLKDNPSGLPEHDDSVSFPITVQ